MLQTRIIPSLLMKNGGLVKGVAFKNHRYIGDPVNAVRIFNDKEVDEITFLDITATVEHRGPDFELLKDIATECFIPLSYGGGIRSMEDAEKLFTLGIERVILNTSAIRNPELIGQIAEVYGSQSLVVSIDLKKSSLGSYDLYSHAGSKHERIDFQKKLHEFEALGAGEILVTSIEREGTGVGFDLALIESVSHAVSIPVVVSGGAGNLDHIRQAFLLGASGVAIGSMFVFYGKHRAVLITYPSQQEIRELVL